MTNRGRCNFLQVLLGCSIPFVRSVPRVLRTPTSDNGNGRDYNHHGFTMWLAGGGIRGGMTFGETDKFGFRVVENPVALHDLHATILHLPGLDH